ncbi:MAG: transposase, partial [Gammaproteobacteria bacterium]
MKVSIAFEHASHVNSGTSVDPAELPWPETEGRVMRHPLLHLESDGRGEMTHYGGLILAQQFVRRFGVAKRLDDGLMLFKRHAPYHESDHVLALAYTLYADGTCLEDQAALQGSEAVRRLVGACRIPDPTTAGDFLRRFKTAQDVEQLSGVIDEVQEAVWSKLSRTMRRRRKKHEYALVDLDGHIKPLYGIQKEGADFSYNGRWSYQPLVVSLGGSGECLKVVNQPGSARSSDAAAMALKEVLPWVRRNFLNAIVRGDSDFDRSDVYNETIDAKAYFAIGGRLYPNRAALVQAIAEKRWEPFVPRADREESSGPSRHVRTANCRQQKAAVRGFRTLRTVKQ